MICKNNVKKQKNKEKQLSEWGRKFFIYFERLIKEQAKREKDYENFNKNAEEKLKEIIYVLAIIEELDDHDIQDISDDELKKLAKDKIEKEKVKLYKSFATKLFATLNPKMPVWDSNVIQSLKTKLSDVSNKNINKFKNNSLKKDIDFDEKVTIVINIYKDICNQENEILKDNETIKEIDKCKEFFKEAKEELKNEKFKIEKDNYKYCDSVDKLITSTKILDFFLWKKATVETNQKNDC